MGRTVAHDIPVKDLQYAYTTEGKSTVQIAREYGIFFADGRPNHSAVQRMLKRYGIQTRDKSLAQVVALELGTAEHPTEGKARTDEEKLKIGKTLIENFDKLDEKEKERRTKGVKEFWANKDNKEKHIEVRARIGQQLKKAVAEGTFLEKTLVKNLSDWGYRVEVHSSGGFLSGTGLEADLVIWGKGINVVMEVDGPHHYSTKFMNKGVEKLAQTIHTDMKKNGQILKNDNVWMVRMLYPYGNETTYVTIALQKLHEVLEYIRQKQKLGKVSVTERFIVVDIQKIVTGKSCTDNPGFKKALALLKKK